jgi:large subunit ribosomal protein L17
MRHRVAGRHLNRTTSHRQAMFRNLVTELFRHGRIKTTQAKAKAIRSDVEKLITVAKKVSPDDAVARMNARRRVDRYVREKSVAVKLFDEIAPRYVDRPGGYTRIYKLGPRLGDGAEMVVLELVE